MAYEPTEHEGFHNTSHARRKSARNVTCFWLPSPSVSTHGEIMRSTGRSFVLTSILVASAVSPLAAQDGMRFGDADATTVLTTSQRTFAEAYLAAVTGSNIEHYKRLLHPTTRACMNRGTVDYFNVIFKRRVGQVATNPRLSVEKLPDKFEMFDALEAHGWTYAVRPTHAFHIDLVATGPKQSMIAAFGALDNGVWYEVLPCPSKQALEEMRQAQAKDEAEWAKARGLAASLRDPLRGELLTLLKHDRPVSAAKRYSEAAHVDLTLATRVVDVLEKGSANAQ